MRGSAAAWGFVVENWHEEFKRLVRVDWMTRVRAPRGAQQDSGGVL